MVKVIDQDIPSDIVDDYDHSLHRAVEYLPGSGLYSVRHRVPFRLPHMQNPSLSTPSKAQRLIRAAFKKSCNCFNLQPWSGGAEPDGIGPYSRTWWYTQSAGSGLFYYDYFIQQTWPPFYQDSPPDWCKVPGGQDTYIDSNSPDTNYGSTNFLAVQNQFYSNQLHELRTFLLKPNPYVSTLHLYCSGYDEIQKTRHYYQITQDWNESTLTWNNQPPIGKYIGSFDQKTYEDPNKWVQLPGITSPSVIIITDRIYENHITLEYPSKDCATESIRPYWT